MLSLNTLKAKKGQKKRRDVGRGHGSGLGTTAGHGTKGQNSRSGVSGLKRLGMRPRILQAPKKRGFTSMYSKNQAVNVVDINANFKDGEIVNLANLSERGLIKRTNQPVKILGKDKLTVKVSFEGVKFSKSIEK